MTPVCHSYRPSHLWILDIDGTLMPSQHVDNECYWRAVFEFFGETPRTLDLDQFEHVTDGSILDEWMQKSRGRSATRTEVQGIQQRFLQRIRESCTANPDAFTATAGLTGWLDQQLAQHGRCIAIATGGWGHTARHKLQVAGLAGYDLPLASSDDGNRRCDIMRKAQNILLAGLLAGTATDTVSKVQPSTCYIGDGTWDFRASQQLGWDFIGIAHGKQADALQRAGATEVFCNFAELQASNQLYATARNQPRNARA